MSKYYIDSQHIDTHDGVLTRILNYDIYYKINNINDINSKSLFSPKWQESFSIITGYVNKTNYSVDGFYVRVIIDEGLFFFNIGGLTFTNYKYSDIRSTELSNRYFNYSNFLSY